jgi:hypothetical protein
MLTQKPVGLVTSYPKTKVPNEDCKSSALFVLCTWVVLIDKSGRMDQRLSFRPTKIK